MIRDHLRCIVTIDHIGLENDAEMLRSQVYVMAYIIKDNLFV